MELLSARIIPQSTFSAIKSSDKGILQSVYARSRIKEENENSVILEIFSKNHLWKFVTNEKYL